MPDLFGNDEYDLIEWKETGNGILLPIKAKPNAKRSALLGVHGGALKIAVAAPPEKGKANAQLIKFLSAVFQIPASSISLSRGATSTQKSFCLTGHPLEEFQSRLRQFVTD